MHSWCPIKYAPSGKKFGSPNLHLCSILSSQDGSRYKVKITAVILSESTQADNSWHRQMWSTEILPACAGYHPHARLLSLDLAEGVSPQCMPTSWASCCYRWAQSPHWAGFNPSSLLWFSHYFLNDMPFRDTCHLVRILFTWGLTQCLKITTITFVESPLCMYILSFNLK